MENLPLDIAFKSFKSQKTQLDALSLKANEATTRLRVIDTILFDVLDWQKEDVEAEAYCRAEGFADYVCSVNDSKLLVIEAKRAEASFVIASECLESRPYSFGFIASESKAASDVGDHQTATNSNHVAVMEATELGRLMVLKDTLSSYFLRS